MMAIKILSCLSILLLACASVSQGIGIVETVDTPGCAQAVFVSRDYAYVADGSSGLLVVDIRDPGNPTIVGSVDTPGPPRYSSWAITPMWPTKEAGCGWWMSAIPRIRKSSALRDRIGRN